MDPSPGAARFSQPEPVPDSRLAQGTPEAASTSPAQLASAAPEPTTTHGSSAAATSHVAASVSGFLAQAGEPSECPTSRGATSSVGAFVADEASSASPAESTSSGHIGSERSTAGHGQQRKLWPVLVLYTALRLALIIALAALLSLFVIPLVALAFAVAIQLPLAWLLFAPIRVRVNEAMAAAGENRRAERERLKRALSGEDG